MPSFDILGLADSSQIGDIVVCLVAIYVVDYFARAKLAVMALKNDSMDSVDGNFAVMASPREIIIPATALFKGLWAIRYGIEYKTRGAYPQVSKIGSFNHYVIV